MWRVISLAINISADIYVFTINSAAVSYLIHAFNFAFNIVIKRVCATTENKYVL